MIKNLFLGKNERERRRKISKSMIGNKNNKGNSGSFKKGHKPLGDNFKAAQKHNKKYGWPWQNKKRDKKTKEKISNTKTTSGIATYARKAYKEYAYRCNKCGIIDKRVLLVHHKDKNRYNNNIENLEVLCWNCHIIKHNRFKKKDGS